MNNLFWDQFLAAAKTLPRCAVERRSSLRSACTDCLTALRLLRPERIVATAYDNGEDKADADEANRQPNADELGDGALANVADVGDCAAANVADGQ